MGRSTSNYSLDCFSSILLDHRIYVSGMESFSAKKINPMLNESCHCITGCLKPTNINSLYILSGISPPDIQRELASRKERMIQVADPRHPLYGQFQHAADSSHGKASSPQPNHWTKMLHPHGCSRGRKGLQLIPHPPVWSFLQWKSYLQVQMCRGRTGTASTA